MPLGKKHQKHVPHNVLPLAMAPVVDKRTQRPPGYARDVGPTRKRLKIQDGTGMDDDEWTRIVAAYSKHHGGIYNTACDLGWSIKKTRRVYAMGFKRQGYPPVRDILAAADVAVEEIRAQRIDVEKELPPSVEITAFEDLPAKAVVIGEAESARIRMMLRREDERAKAREDAIKARGEEAMMVQINRRNSLALNGVTATLLKGALALGERIQQELQTEAESTRLTTADKLALLKSVASIARYNSEATMLAAKTERMVLGQPIDAPGDTDGGEAALDEALEWIESAKTAITRAHARGLLNPAKH